MNQRQPNIMLMRRLFFQDATVGELLDPKGQQFCLTLEPAVVRPRGSVFCQRKGKAIPEGIYPLEYYYDSDSASFCFKINRIKGIGAIRLCALPNQDIFPSQTIGDILLGMHFDAGRGCLTGSSTAMYLLQRYHNHLRSLNQRPVLEVRNGDMPTDLLPPLGIVTPPPVTKCEVYDWEDLLLG